MGENMFSIISALILLGIGFVSGYGLRDLQSRRRRAIARAEWQRRQEEKLLQETGGAYLHTLQP